MKRLNLTLLLAMAVTIGVTGCSGGKLRNLLSRSDYQTLEEQDSGQPAGLESDATLVVSSETDKSDGFFKLPRFLGGKDDSSGIAPDPFATTDDALVADESIKAYQARVDERIAREAQEANRTLSDVEQQARELAESSKNSASNPFAGFGEEKVAAADTKTEAQTSPTSQSETASNAFEEMFGQQPATSKSEVASPLIAQNSPVQSAASSEGFSEPAQALSEFDKILQAHQQQEAGVQPASSTEPQRSGFEELLAASQQPTSETTTAAEVFGSDFAVTDSNSSPQADTGFEAFMKANNEGGAGTETSSSNQLWGQPAEESQSEDVFAAAAKTERQSAATDTVFSDNFQQTASNHGFASDRNPWEQVATGSDSAGGIDVASVELDNHPSGFPADQFSMSQDTQAAFDSQPTTASSAASPFVSVSQSTPVTTSGSTSPGLIIPASESSDSGAFFDFAEQPSPVHQISATSSVSDVSPVVTSGDMSLGSGVMLDAGTTEELAVQTEVSAEGWPRRNWFLIIGCVLIAGLLFLPERQKR